MQGFQGPIPQQGLTEAGCVPTDTQRHTRASRGHATKNQLSPFS